jgi:tRNA(fMet)-specific endonuclease VapC
VLTPPSGRLLLDTSIVIELLAGEDTVVSNLDRATGVFIPAVVVGELFFEAAKSGRPSENTANVENLSMVDWA